MKKYIQKVYEEVWAYLFPLFCVVCKHEGGLLCGRCQKDIDLNAVFACPYCHKTTRAGEICPACISHTTGLSQVVSFTKYQEHTAMDKLLHAYKYAYQESVLLLYRQLFTDFFARFPELYAGVDYLVPIPLHRRRFAERGFNQSVGIAKELGAVRNMPMHDMLCRKRYTNQQALLSQQERQENMQDAFALLPKKEALIYGKRILLVDDVYTTGATMQSAAAVLKSAGAKEVCGFTILRSI